MSDKPLSEQLAEDSMLHLWMSYCQLKQDNEQLRGLLDLAKAEHYCTREWDPDGLCKSPFCVAVRAAE
jgi:hypothetical protein